MVKQQTFQLFTFMWIGTPGSTVSMALSIFPLRPWMFLITYVCSSLVKLVYGRITLCDLSFYIICTIDRLKSKNAKGC